MEGTKDLEKIIALTLASAYIKDEKPASLMIVSDRPESGKTQLVNKYDGTDGIALLSDATAFALWRDFGKRIERNLIKHIIIPEFLAPLSRNKSTVNSFIAMLQMMMEEGLREIHTGFLKQAIEFDEPKVVGVITCLPSITYVSNRLSWLVSGFLTRFIVVTYKYSQATIMNIFNSILGREYMNENNLKLKFPNEKMEVIMPREIGVLCQELALDVTRKERASEKLYGFREVKNILRLVASNVVLDNIEQNENRNQATQKDFAAINKISYLLNEEYNELKGE